MVEEVLLGQPVVAGWVVGRHRALVTEEDLPVLPLGTLAPGGRRQSLVEPPRGAAPGERDAKAAGGRRGVAGRLEDPFGRGGGHLAGVVANDHDARQSSHLGHRITDVPWLTAAATPGHPCAMNSSASLGPQVPAS